MKQYTCGCGHFADEPGRIACDDCHDALVEHLDDLMVPRNKRDKILAAFELFAAFWAVVLFLVLLYVAVPIIYQIVVNPNHIMESCK